ncbi:hypothetical protein ACIQC9_07665 [Brevundimonas sp. NPDC092305]|uniref:hypothetical protein n=1 Tax=Brevundimonas sp. NPDC092305 TaxID=3363957 RepID=UPI00382A9BE0
MKRLRTSGFILAVAVLSATTAIWETAAACSLVRYSDNGRYVGGNLVAQVAAKADLIQLVRVTEKRVVYRTYSLGRWYRDYGDTELPAGQPEYVDHFVFTLEAVDTLKGTLDSEPFLIEDPLRVVGYDSSTFGSGAYPTSREGESHPNQLPTWVFDRPANAGYAFIGASEEAGLGSGECSLPYFVEVGQLFVALRMSDGRLYPPGGGFPLELDVELARERGGRRRESLNMQSLIPVTSADDPLIAQLRQSIAGVD